MAKMIKAWIEKTSKNPNILFWLAWPVLLVWGMIVAKDFGISWDEPMSHHIGRLALDFVLHGKTEYWIDLNVYYGVYYEMLINGVQRLLGWPDGLAIYTLRHYLLFILFCFTGVVFYRALRNFLGEKYALLAFLFMITQPRLTVNAFYNSKDALFAMLMILSFVSMESFVRRPSLGKFCLHALLCALAFEIRLFGALIPALTILSWPAAKGERLSGKNILLRVLWLFLFLIFVYWTWPYLWPDPAGNLKEVFMRMAHYPLVTESLFLGQRMQSDNLPWYYLPGWIALTSPPLIFILAVLGSGMKMVSAIKTRCVSLAEQTELRLLAVLILPLGHAMLLKPCLYDSWRHYYFLIPPMAVFAAVAWKKIMSKLSHFRLRLMPPAMALILSLGLLEPAAFILRQHPYGHLYFNAWAELACRPLNRCYDLDYWGLSFREGLKWILKNNSDPQIKIAFSNWAGYGNSWALNESDRARVFLTTNLNEADYYISNYRWQQTEIGGVDEVYTRKIGRTKIMSVFRLPAHYDTLSKQ